MNETTIPTHRLRDTTGWCDRGVHDDCRGVLWASMGHHWWCACECHSEPTPSPAATERDNALALATWWQAHEHSVADDAHKGAR